MKVAACLLALGLSATSAGACRQPYPDLDLELEWARAVHERFGKEVRCIEPGHAAYLLGVMETLAKQATPRSPYSLSACIIDSQEVNAYALPGGKVYVNAGLLQESPSESALAWVLGHELSHVLLRHSFHMQKRIQKIRDIRTTKLAVPAGLVGILGLLQFSRSYEKSADLRALGLVRRAGFDPAGSVQMMERFRLLHFSRRNIFGSVLATHPRPQKRLRTLRRRVARMRRPEPRAVESAQYRALKKRFAAPTSGK